MAMMSGSMQVGAEGEIPAYSYNISPPRGTYGASSGESVLILKR